MSYNLGQILDTPMICIRTAYEPSCNANFLPHELSRTNSLHINFIFYELFECKLYPIQTFNTTNFCHYELFTIRTSAYEHLLTSLFLYEPYVYELWFWKRS